MINYTLLYYHYAGPKGKNIIESMNNNIQQVLRNNVRSRITYVGRKLRTKFQIKDLTENPHEHDLIYYSKYPESYYYYKDYLVENGRRRIERAAGHCGKISDLTYLNMH